MRRHPKPGPRVIHLVDDATAGGVMRVLDHLAGDPVLARAGIHEIRQVRRGELLRPGPAAVIVSHLAIRWGSLPALISLRAGHPGTPLVHVEHSYTERFVALNVTRRTRFASLLRVSYALFDRVVAVSAAQGRWLVQRGHVPAPRLRVIRSCVDLAPFRALPPPGPVARVAAIGRLDRQKGFDLLVQAVRAARGPVGLDIHGTGADEPMLRALAGGDPRIVFHGAGDPVAALRAAQAVAMPSRWEACGLVALEALSARRPLLVAPVDGLADHLAFGARPVGADSIAAWALALDALEGTRPIPHPLPALERDFARGWHALLAELTGKEAAEARRPETTA